ncbi:unnamed protein product [Phytomonas sp. EM1]|nr:unnamed protein product [Phytomonas sp. EM1]|eukprot:CCW60092.1 unnamed protein product [Phytomonas sp. isolate EM1]
MAEDRAIEALLAGCLSGDVYSPWTTVRSFLERRYLSPNSRGSVEDACAFILKAFKVAVLPCLAAEIAEKLCESLFEVLRRYHKPLNESFAMHTLLELREQFKLVLDDPVTSPVILDQAEGPQAAPVIVPACETIERRISFYAAHLWFCESVFFGILREEKLAREAASADPHSSLDSWLPQWKNEWVEGIMMDSRRFAHYLFKSLASRPSSEGQSASNQNERPQLPILQRWTLLKVWQRVMRWSIHSEKSIVRKRNMETVWKLLVTDLSPLQTRWVLALFVHDVLLSSEAFPERAAQAVADVEQAGLEGGKRVRLLPSISIPEAIEGARLAIQIGIEQGFGLQKGETNFMPEGSGHDEIAKCHEWDIFLQCFVAILEGNGLGKRPCGASEGASNANGCGSDAFRKLYRRLCNFFSGRLKELPFLDWEAVAAAYA